MWPGMGVRLDCDVHSGLRGIVFFLWRWRSRVERWVFSELKFGYRWSEAFGFSLQWIDCCVL